MLKSITLAIFLALASTSAHAFPFDNLTIDFSSSESFKQSFEEMDVQGSEVERLAFFFGIIWIMYDNLPPERRNADLGKFSLENPLMNINQSMEYARETNLDITKSEVEEYVASNETILKAAEKLAPSWNPK